MICSYFVFNKYFFNLGINHLEIKTEGLQMCCCGFDIGNPLTVLQTDDLYSRILNITERQWMKTSSVYFSSLIFLCTSVSCYICRMQSRWILIETKKRKYVFTAISNIYLTEHRCISMTKSFQVINSQLDICWLSVREKHICTYKIVTCPASLSHPFNITKIGKHLKRVRNYLYKQKDLYIQVYPYRFLLDSKLFSTDSWTCWVEAAHSAAVQRPQSLTVSPLGGIRALLCFSVSWNHVLYLWYLKASLFILLLLYSAPIYLELTCYSQRTEVKS